MPPCNLRHSERFRPVIPQRTGWPTRRKLHQHHMTFARSNRIVLAASLKQFNLPCIENLQYAATTFTIPDCTRGAMIGPALCKRFAISRAFARTAFSIESPDCPFVSSIAGEIALNTFGISPVSVAPATAADAAVLVPEYNNQMRSQVFDCVFDAAQANLVHHFSGGANDKNVA